MTDYTCPDCGTTLQLHADTPLPPWMVDQVRVALCCPQCELSIVGSCDAVTWIGSSQESRDLFVARLYMETDPHRPENEYD